MTNEQWIERERAAFEATFPVGKKCLSWDGEGYVTSKPGCIQLAIIHTRMLEAWLAAKREAVPNEQGKNRYGLDVAYFRNAINRELNRPLVDYRPHELARVFARFSVTADSSVIFEPEFQRLKPPAPGGE